MWSHDTANNSSLQEEWQNRPDMDRIGLKCNVGGGGDVLCDHVTQHSAPPYRKVWLNRPDLDRIGLKL
jgi:hypothetical protein